MSHGLAAVTGATGFLGQHVVRALADAGWRVRVLARRDPVSPFWAGLEPDVTPGDLGDPAALSRLCQGADLVVHAAGRIAGDPRSLFEVNVEGGRRLSAAVPAGARVLSISSLAAREPGLSPYAASKRAGETAAREILGERLTVVRPPVIYGPGDRETLRIFRLAAVSPVLPLLHPTARVAVVHVQDAARQIVALAGSSQSGPLALCDGRRDGYGWRELMQTAALACNRRPRLMRIPDALLYALAAGAGIGNGWRHGTVMLTLGKIRELTHRDWGIGLDECASEAPAPQFDLLSGFQQTVGWYRTHAWL